jgi:hypothetical protein
MTVNTQLALAIGSVILALVSIFARDLAPQEPPGEKRERPAVPYLMLLGLIGVVFGLAFFFQNQYDKAMLDAISFSSGVFISALSFGIGLFPNQTKAGRAAPFALGVMGIALLALVPDCSPAPAIFGSAVAAWLLNFGVSEETNFWGARSAIALSLTGCLNMLAAHTADRFPAEITPVVGTALGLTATLAILIACIVKDEAVRGFLCALLAALGIWVVGEYVLKSTEFRYIGGGSALIALVLHSVTRNMASDRLRMILCSVIAVSAGTAAFGLEKGVGMAVCLLILATILMAFRNDTATLALGPLAGLTFYRLFREDHLDATKAFEIGQHYVMVGILIGIALPMLAQEWLANSAGKTKFFGGLAGLVWVPILIGAPIAAAVLLGAKGVVGYLFGLGIASIASVPRGERSVHTLTLAMGLSASMTLTFPWISHLLELSKEQKVQYLGIIVGAVLVFSVLIAVLSGDFKRSKNVETTV